MALLKVFTSSFSIKAALGNLKISDDSLRSSHPYFWICDMRNPGGRSFVEVFILIDFTCLLGAVIYYAQNCSFLEIIFFMNRRRIISFKIMVQIDFTSYNVGDEDYCGYDYSLVGQLSEVRIVYLNRFVQEVWSLELNMLLKSANSLISISPCLQIISYFMGLVPKSSDSVVKLKDNTTNSEKWVSKTDMEGSPALKLDVSFSRPIIVMPRETDSAE